MADVMKLKKGGTTITFSPLARHGAYLQPGNLKRVTHEALDGTPYIYDFGSKDMYVIEINNVNENSMGTIRAWWEAGSTLKFFADVTNAALTSLSVRIMGKQFPLRIMPEGGWQENEFATCIYEGTLILRES